MKNNIKITDRERYETKEANVQKLVLLAASSVGCILHRNNVGAYKTKEGHFIRYGVGGVGGSDLIGWTKDGIFVAIETKRTKKSRSKTSDDQINFIKQVKLSGGRAGVARSAADALKIIGG
jgi:hypothetical protein